MLLAQFIPNPSINGCVRQAERQMVSKIACRFGKSSFTSLSMLLLRCLLLDLLLNMREGRNHIAFVVDEYGGIAGLVTIEDALEKIIGSIEDEHDIVANDNGISYYKNNSAIINGRYKLEELENKFGKLLNDAQRQENLDTVGGLVIYLAGRVPAKGELIPWKINDLDRDNKQILKNKKNVEFEILQSLPNRIVEVQLHGLDLRKKSQK